MHPERNEVKSKGHRAVEGRGERETTPRPSTSFRKLHAELRSGCFIYFLSFFASRVFRSRLTTSCISSQSFFINASFLARDQVLIRRS